MKQARPIKPIYIILLLVFLMAGYQTWQHYQFPQQNERFANYIESRKEAISKEDSVWIEKHYEKLCAVFQKVSQADSGLQAFSKVDKTTIGSDMEPRLCTIDLLDFICDGPVVSARLSQSKEAYKKQLFLQHSQKNVQYLNNYIGNGDFMMELLNRKWHGGTKKEILNMQKDQYLLVLTMSNWQLPMMAASQQEYKSGFFKGTLFVLRIDNAEIVGIAPIFAQNDSNIQVSKYIKGDADNKLTENLISNLQKAISQSSISFFGKPLQDMEKKIYGLN